MTSEMSAAPASRDLSRWGQRIAAALLVGAVFVVYLPAVHAGYVWDDDLHLLNNPVLKPGGLAQIWVPGTYINYWPLTFSTYWLEAKLWGVGNPAGFHLVNILLHAACALLIWQVLQQLFVAGANDSWAPLLGAAIFALHPVNVESVAWVAQLKNVLSLFLSLSALWLFLHHERTGQWRSYVLAVAVFAMSTLAKGIALTIPVVLLALAWWQRGRIERRDVWRSLPFLIIGALMACMEVAMQKEGQPWEVPRTDGALSRLAGAGWCVWFYCYKLIWPLNLSFVYPRWTIDGARLLSFVPDALLLAAALVAWVERRRWGRGVFVMLSCYVALLLPVLGFTNIYFMRYSFVADHWQYAAMIVPAAGVAAFVAGAPQRRIPGAIVTAVMVTMLFSLGALTYKQAGNYKDVETLWRDVLRLNPDSWLPHYQLGNWLASEGRFEEAATQYEATVRLNSDNFHAYNNLAVVLHRLNRLDDAIVNYERSLALDGEYAMARENLISAYKDRGKQLLLGTHDYQTARRYYLRLTKLTPRDAEAHYGLGRSLIETGEIAQGVNELQEAVANNALFVPAQDLLAQTLATRNSADGGDPERALRAARRACDLTACQDAIRLDTLATAYASAGRFDEAVATEDRALEAARLSDSTLVAPLQARRNLFRAHKPYRAAPASAQSPTKP